MSQDLHDGLWFADMKQLGTKSEARKSNDDDYPDVLRRRYGTSTRNYRLALYSSHVGYGLRKSNDQGRSNAVLFFCLDIQEKNSRSLE
jgi:hypothetical protein